MKLNPEQAKRFLEDVLEDVAAASSAVPKETPVDQPDDPHPDPRPLGESSPQRIGRFVIVRKLAEGGMGTVYLAQQSNPNREVAIKVFARGDVDRFRQEAETLGRLKHPGIAHVHESGSHNDGLGARPYFVMEYLPNAEPLTHFARRARLDLDQKLELFLQVCDAVQHAHLKGVIHRDLKPGNILATYEVEAVSGKPSAVSDPSAVNIPLAPGSAGGPSSLFPSPPETATPWPVRVCLIDFGVARITNADLKITLLPTTTSEILGTMQYMSPEQCLGRIGDIDTRSDVYTLGVILYELLCGRLPYDIADDATITGASRIIEQQEPIRPTAIIHRFPRGLEAVVLKALEKKPERRYQSAAGLAEDVKRYLNGEPVEARGPSRWRRAIRSIEKHPLRSTLAASVVLGLTLVTAIGWVISELQFRRPVRFGLISNDERLCEVLSRSNIVVDRIGGATDSHISVATVADRPDHFGGGRMAMFAVEGTRGEYATDAQLRTAPLGSLDDKVWETLPNLEVPWPCQHLGKGFGIRNAFFADVFSDEDHPGDEIVAIHSHAGSPWCVRVYDWSGAVKFEAWHFGPIYSVEWIAPQGPSQPGVLVCAGDRHGIDWNGLNVWVGMNEQLSNYPWLEALDKGASEPLKHGDWPSVVFGLWPRPDVRLGFVNDLEDAAMDSSLAWYCWMTPLRLSRVDNRGAEVGVAKSNRPGDSGHVQVRFIWRHSTGSACATAMLDGQGRLTEKGRGDEYAALLSSGVVPPYDTFALEMLSQAEVRSVTLTMDSIAARPEVDGGPRPTDAPSTIQQRSGISE